MRLTNESWYQNTINYTKALSIEFCIHLSNKASSQNKP